MSVVKDVPRRDLNFTEKSGPAARVPHIIYALPENPMVDIFRRK